MRNIGANEQRNARASVHYEGYQEVIIPINDLAANCDKLAVKAAARS